MRKFWTIALAGWLTLAIATVSGADVLLKNVVIVDVETGLLSPGQSVLIEGNTITAIGSDFAGGGKVANMDAGGLFFYRASGTAMSTYFLLRPNPRSPYPSI